MSWSARLTHTTTGLAIVFAGPVCRLDMTADVAQHLASLLAVEARHRLAGVVRTLEAENACASVLPMREQPKTSKTHLNSVMAENKANRAGGDRQNGVAESFLPENMPVQVIGNHPLCCTCDRCLNGD